MTLYVSLNDVLCIISMTLYVLLNDALCIITMTLYVFLTQDGLAMSSKLYNGKKCISLALNRLVVLIVDRLYYY